MRFSYNKHLFLVLCHLLTNVAVISVSWLCKQCLMWKEIKTFFICCRIFSSFKWLLFVILVYFPVLCLYCFSLFSSSIYFITFSGKITLHQPVFFHFSQNQREMTNQNLACLHTVLMGIVTGMSSVFFHYHFVI